MSGPDFLAADRGNQTLATADLQPGSTTSAGAEMASAHGVSPRRPPLTLLIPALLVALVMLLPVAYLILRASQAGSGIWDTVFDPRTGRILLNTALLAAAVAFGGAVIAVPLAWLTTRTDLPGRKAFGTLAALPLVIPSFVGAVAYIAALGPRGFVADWLQERAGVGEIPSIYGFPGAWLVLTLFTYPYIFIGVRAAIAGLDPALEDAARGLGRSSFSAFWSVTLPQLRPAIVAGMLLSALYAVSDFGVVTLFRYDAFTRAIYLQYRSSFDRTHAAVLSLLLVALTVGILVLEGQVRGRATYHRIGAGSARAPRPVPLGGWTIPATLFAALVAVMSLLLPLGVLGWWFLRSIRRGDDFGAILLPAWHSVSAGSLAAIFATLAALPIAILATRYRSRAGSLLERIAWLGYGLPGIVIALSFVFIGANYLPRLYQTLPLMVIAYVIRFLPQALGAQEASLLQVSPRLEEAARGLGRSTTEAIQEVTIPLARPGILAGALLVLLTVVKELPITLLLGPTGYATLATRIWTEAGAGRFGRASAPALLLVAISAIPTFLLTVRVRERGGDSS